MIYLDWASTSIPDSDILDKVRDAEKEYFGNPSSIHSAGRKAHKLLIQSREMLAEVIKVEPSELVFTSGGTESNNSILFSLLSGSLLKARSGKRIIISSIEHPSVYNPVQVLKRMEFEVVFIHPASSGFIDPGKIADAIDPDTVLVACMYVNNETGAVQPVEEFGKIIRDKEKMIGRKILFHVDAVQALGKIPFYPHSMNIDTASMSAHKLGGPKGSGALFVNKGRAIDFLYKGGDQEGRRRPGTENVAGAYGLALAAKKAVSEMDERFKIVRVLMKKVIQGLERIQGIVFVPEIRTGDDRNTYSPYILKIAFPGLPGEVLVRMLEDKGILVSTGSACSSRKKKGKHRVLENMGIPADVAESSIRISPGHATTEEEIEILISTLATLVPELRKMI